MSNKTPVDQQVHIDKPIHIENIQEHFDKLRATSLSQSQAFLNKYFQEFHAMFQMIQAVAVIQNTELAMLRELEQHLRQETLTVEIATDILSRIAAFRAENLARITAQVEAAKQNSPK